MVYLEQINSQCSTDKETMVQHSNQVHSLFMFSCRAKNRFCIFTSLLKKEYMPENKCGQLNLKFIIESIKKVPEGSKPLLPLCGLCSFLLTFITKHSNTKRCPQGLSVYMYYTHTLPYVHCAKVVQFPLVCHHSQQRNSFLCLLVQIEA